MIVAAVDVANNAARLSYLELAWTVHEDAILAATLGEFLVWQRHALCSCCQRHVENISSVHKSGNVPTQNKPCRPQRASRDLRFTIVDPRHVTACHFGKRDSRHRVMPSPISTLPSLAVLPRTSLDTYWHIGEKLLERADLT
jgi:hypothetical protein